MKTSFASNPDPSLLDAIRSVTSIGALLDRAAEPSPDKCALVSRSIDAPWRRLTYAELREATLRVALGLRACGIGKGDHVGIFATGAAYLECLVGYLAMARLGAVLVPLNPRYAAEELAFAIKHADCVAVIAESDSAQRVELLRERLPRLRITIGIGRSLPNGWTNWHSLLEREVDRAADWPLVRPDDLANILFTSGTTGNPKAVLHTHRTAIATGAIIATSIGLRGDDIYQHAIPFYTSSGSQITIMAVLWARATMIAEGAFDSAALLQQMEQERTSVFLGVPSHYLFLIEQMQRRDYDLASMRLWNYGGAPMPHTVIRELARRFPQVDQRHSYGMTETGPTGTVLTPDQTLHRIGSIGRPMPLCEIRILDSQDASGLDDPRGEILVRSPACMVGYFHNEAATSATLTDGWVRTGDIGRLDEEGFLYYEDRLKDVINRGGLKISSMEIEDVMYRHAAVQQAAVIAVPHPKLGEDVVAFVVLKPGMTLDDASLAAFCADKLADYKIPRRLEILDEMPRNAMGKVLKTALRERALH